MQHHQTVGIVGLGLVGQAIAKRLQCAQISLLGFDTSKAASDAFKNLQFEVAENLMALAQKTQILILCVFNSNDVQKIANQLIDFFKDTKPLVLIDCSTGDARTLTQVAQQLQKVGMKLIEAPLSGSSQQIANGQATMMMGGSLQVIEQHASLLDAISQNRIHVGPTGMGAKAKLATNLVLGLNRAALAEGMVFAQKLGIQPQDFLDLVLASPAQSQAAVAKGQKMVDQEFKPQSRVRQHLKDVELMIDMAQEQGQNLPLSSIHAKLLQDLVALGHGDLDNAAIIEQIRRLTI
ncbi:MAG: NAD(P)-dependent oxidoreductase [Burkholderiaceae bacterium]